MPRLNLTADEPADLLAQLSAIDITVPLRTEGRTTEHCERYTMARLLATLANTPAITYPLRVQHGDRPDFLLHLPNETIGVEVTEAVSDEWAHIDAIRERHHPDALIMLPMLKPGQRTLTKEERVLISRGAKSGPPWVGDMAERQWADAIAHFVERKTTKLRSGSYPAGRQNWLLIQDEWPVPVYGLDERREAAEMCVPKLKPYLVEPAFSRIYVCNSRWMLRLWPEPIEICPILALWR